MEMSDLLLVTTPRHGQQILSVICTRLIVTARNIITLIPTGYEGTKMETSINLYKTDSTLN